MDHTTPPMPLLCHGRRGDSPRWLFCPHGVDTLRVCVSCWQAGLKFAISEAIGEVQKELQQTKAAVLALTREE